jgi:hypothetical protein
MSINALATYTLAARFGICEAVGIHHLLAVERLYEPSTARFSGHSFSRLSFSIPVIIRIHEPSSSIIDIHHEGIAEYYIGMSASYRRISASSSQR